MACLLCSNSTVFQTVQLVRVFNDSKTFVDSPTVRNPALILADFQNLALPAVPDAGTLPLVDTAQVPDVPGWTDADRQKLKDFVQQNFQKPGAELEVVDLSKYDGYGPTPDFLGSIVNDKLRGFASNVHGKWGHLAKRINMTQICADCESSIIPVDNDFIIPGQRFVESYYWDSYFIIRGLLVSGLHTMARNMIMNFVGSVERFGFVPNGLRQYYLCRSQPPFLTLIVRDYIKATNDVASLDRVLPALDAEYAFWMRDRTIMTDQGLLNLYNTTCSGPRPESYYEDATKGNKLPADQRYAFYHNVAATAESGWDFSTRWFKDPLDTTATLLNLTTTHIAPLDLHAILSNVEYALANLHRLHDSAAPNTTASYAKPPSAVDAAYYDAQHAKRVQQFELFWNPAAGAYMDLELVPGSNDTTTTTTIAHRPEHAAYASELTALWSLNETDSLNTVDADGSKRSAIWKRWQKGLMEYPGGVPTSFMASGQQWDSDNAWPPLQYFALHTLAQVNNDSVINLAQRVVNAAYCSWLETDTANHTGGFMFEKYNASHVGLIGGGGEYVTQEGFGWTNGVILWALDKYGQGLQEPECPPITNGTSQEASTRATAPAAAFPVAGVIGALAAVALLGTLAVFGYKRYQRRPRPVESTVLPY
ncbi:hypothetical protein RI367_004951 [Sorochytrium milnesiophthora]